MLETFGSIVSMIDVGWLAVVAFATGQAVDVPVLWLVLIIPELLGGEDNIYGEELFVDQNFLRKLVSFSLLGM